MEKRISHAGERVSLGEKNIFHILNLLKSTGWKIEKNILETVDRKTMIIHGNTRQAVFWHVSEYIAHSHKDTFKYGKNSLTRQCPEEGNEMIATYK